jgi:hypothetical protein
VVRRDISETKNPNKPTTKDKKRGAKAKLLIQSRLGMIHQLKMNLKASIDLHHSLLTNDLCHRESLH